MLILAFQPQPAQEVEHRVHGTALIPGDFSVDHRFPLQRIEAQVGAQDIVAVPIAGLWVLVGELTQILRLGCGQAAAMREVEDGFERRIIVALCDLPDDLSGPCPGLLHGLCFVHDRKLQLRLHVLGLQH